MNESFQDQGPSAAHLDSSRGDQIKALKLEVQELRQCLGQIILAQRNSALSEKFVDYWWPKLTGYQKVE